MSDIGDGRFSGKEAQKRYLSSMLRQELKKRSWSQSDLARHANLPRDAISVYIRGKSLPTQRSLAALSQALGIPEDELQIGGAKQTKEEADFELRTIPGTTNLAWLYVNRRVSLATAIKIAELLEADSMTGTRQ